MFAKKNSLFILIILFVCIHCKKESDDCHFFVKIKNNSNHEITFAYSGFPSDNNLCSLHDNVKNILSNQSFKYRPYDHDCIESRVALEGYLRPLFIIDPNNHTTDIVPCEEFEVQNTILRTYVLTLEDLERMNYTINYPEDASIGLE